MKFPPGTFDQFFDESVKVTAPRSGGIIYRGTYAACVMPIADVDPFATDAAATNVQRFTVLLKRIGYQGWNASMGVGAPQIGDQVELPSGVKAAVFKVSPVVDDWYEMEVRSC